MYFLIIYLTFLLLLTMKEDIFKSYFCPYNESHGLKQCEGDMH